MPYYKTSTWKKQLTKKLCLKIKFFSVYFTANFYCFIVDHVLDTIS